MLEAFVVVLLLTVKNPSSQELLQGFFFSPLHTPNTQIHTNQVTLFVLSRFSIENCDRTFFPHSCSVSGESYGTKLVCVESPTVLSFVLSPSMTGVSCCSLLCWRWGYRNLIPVTLSIIPPCEEPLVHLIASLSEAGHRTAWSSKREPDTALVARLSQRTLPITHGCSKLLWLLIMDWSCRQCADLGHRMSVLLSFFLRGFRVIMYLVIHTFKLLITGTISMAQHGVYKC